MKRRGISYCYCQLLLAVVLPVDLNATKSLLQGVISSPARILMKGGYSQVLRGAAENR